TTSQGPRAIALTTAGAPVRWETSPVNWPLRWTVTRLGSSPEKSTISTSPDVTTKNFGSRSPTANSVCPSLYDLDTADVQPLSRVIWVSSSVGKAMDRRSSSAMPQCPVYGKDGKALPAT